MQLIGPGIFESSVNLCPMPEISCYLTVRFQLLYRSSGLCAQYSSHTAIPAACLRPQQETYALSDMVSHTCRLRAESSSIEHSSNAGTTGELENVLHRDLDKTRATTEVEHVSSEIFLNDGAFLTQNRRE